MTVQCCQVSSISQIVRLLRRCQNGNPICAEIQQLIGRLWFTFAGRKRDFMLTVMTEGLCMSEQALAMSFLLLPHLPPMPLWKGSVITFLVRVKLAPNSSHVMTHDNALSYFTCHSFIPPTRAVQFVSFSSKPVRKFSDGNKGICHFNVFAKKESINIFHVAVAFEGAFTFSKSLNILPDSDNSHY